MNQACLTLTVSLTSMLSSPELSQEKMPRIHANRICIIRLSSLGDAVHTLGLVDSLRKGYPDAHLTWILQPLPYEIVKHQTKVDRCVVFDPSRGFNAWRELARELKGEKFDLVLILQVSLKASLVSRLVGGKVKLGFDFRRSREAHWLFSNRRIPYHEPQHVQAQFLEFLDYLEIEDPCLQWDFGFTEEEHAWRTSFFDNIDRRVVSFVIASSKPAKDWHIPGYVKAMDYVDDRLNMQPMIIGGPSEREHRIAQEVVQRCQSNPVLALEKPIRRTLLQLSGSSVVVAPDTGPLHMAVAMNIPTVSLYGYSNPRRCGPFRRFHDLLIDKYNDPGEEDARITRATREGRMDLITPEEVIEKIELALRKYH